MNWTFKRRIGISSESEKVKWNKMILESETIALKLKTIEAQETDGSEQEEIDIFSEEMPDFIHKN